MNKGVLTMAYGPAPYLRMAKGLARSIRLRNPEAQLAVVTDREPGVFGGLFDVVLPVNEAFGTGLAHKLCLDRYSPFESTLYIDSDFLVFRDLALIWKRFESVPGFGLIGHYLAPGADHYAVDDMKAYLAKLGLSRIVMTNTGILYFDRSPTGARVFDAARSLAQQAQTLGLRRHPAGFFNDEPIFGTVVEMLGLPFVPTGDHSAFTLACFDTEGMADIDVRLGRSRHRIQGQTFEPDAVHFNVYSQKSFTYDRELRRLEFWPWAKPLADRLTDVLWTIRKVRREIDESGTFGAKARIVVTHAMASAKWLLRKVPVLHGALVRLRERWRSVGTAARKDPLRAAIDGLSGRSGVTFVQVGSNDGRQGDPFYEYVVRDERWYCVFIEPVRFVFERLKKNYGNASRFRFLNLAIGDERGTRDFYYVGEEAKTIFSDPLPFWYDQLGSFDRAHILRHLEGKLEPFIRTERVECVPLPEIFRSCQLGRVDLLHIDTEGFDYKVLSQLDFLAFAPKIILYEHKWLSDAEKMLAVALLRRNGYRITPYGEDTLAVRSWWSAIRCWLG